MEPWRGRCSFFGCNSPQEKKRDGSFYKFCSWEHFKEAQCKLKGCRKPREPRKDGWLHSYCSVEHRDVDMKWSYRGVASGGHGGGLKHAGIQNRSGCGSGGQFSSSGGANFDGQSEYASRKKSKKHEHVVETVSNDRNVHHSNRCYSGGAENTGSSRRKRKRQRDTILFYDKDKPYYEFTNFYCGEAILIDDVKWKTTEHYFQAQKFTGTPYIELVRNMSRPREAFDFSRNPSVSMWRRPDWEEVKQLVMYKALLAKFTQSMELRRLLAETGNRALVEHSPYDRYWGDGGDGHGQNHLGKLLMKVRSLISREKSDTSVLADVNDCDQHASEKVKTLVASGVSHFGGKDREENLDEACSSIMNEPLLDYNACIERSICYEDITRSVYDDNDSYKIPTCCVSMDDNS